MGAGLRAQRVGTANAYEVQSVRSSRDGDCMTAPRSSVFLRILAHTVL